MFYKYFFFVIVPFPCHREISLRYLSEIAFILNMLSNVCENGICTAPHTYIMRLLPCILHILN
jgi:hypothetical protein